MTTSNTVLVLGGTGKTGSRVAALLRERSVPVRIGSRSARTPFDWADRGTWDAALAGVRAVYIAYQPDLAVPGAPDAINALVGAARRHGVEQLVLLSGRGEPEAAECEQIVRDSGLRWTVLRCGWFAQNFSEGAFADYILAGEVALPAGAVPEPFVDADDIADVAVAAFTEDRHDGQVYEITGPRALTFAEAVAEIARATGRPIAYIPIDRAEFVAGLTAYGLSADEIGLLDYLFGTVLDGRNSQPADGVQRALGRKPRDFSEYVRNTAATGVWSAGA
ncbi:NAD(P)H-binding protein [Nocardia sp. CDC159]|uniref:NAD(P)H-binding protein n=1 Tax=Nocardia pulmonis TaxID=2951408 RepID=A0A9X2EB19_9NOCA|nr:MULTISPECIES: NAD(P)H-binding protein [Nocardia]MCM6776960.1 NAD(P)H-binding protein [Nocardia pulmonis]MCM6789384.1 NAD(P)H-binding protein [Nocardia sp. CDC159]